MYESPNMSPHTTRYGSPSLGINAKSSELCDSGNESKENISIFTLLEGGSYELKSLSKDINLKGVLSKV